MQLILLRGLPGSGKTTFAQVLAANGFGYIEADMYWENENIPFTPSKLKEAHQWCQDSVDAFMEYGHQIVVSNTFTQFWEMQPYFNLAKKHGYTVTVLITENYHGNKSVHGVPDKTVQKMKERFEFNW